MADLKKLDIAIDTLEAHAKTLEPAIRIHSHLLSFQKELESLGQSIAGNQAQLAGIAKQTQLASGQLTDLIVQLSQERADFQDKLRTDFSTLSQAIASTLASNAEVTGTAIHRNQQETNELLEHHQAIVRSEIQAALARLGTTIGGLSEEQREHSNGIVSAFAVLSQKTDANLSSYSEKVSLCLEDNHRGTFGLLEKHKSDLQMEIRNEGVQIQRGLENAVNEKLLALHTFVKQSIVQLNAAVNEHRRYLIGTMVLAAMGLLATIAVALWSH